MGENHQVTVGFDDVKDKLAPVSAVVSLASFNSAETGEQLAYIGDTLVDWFYEGKVMGVQVDGGRTVTARIFDSVGTVALKSALETAGYVFPETSKTLVQIMEELEANPEAALARMDTLASQMAELAQAANITEEATPEPDSTGSAPANESTESAAPQVPGINMNIFGQYTVVSNYGDETETTTVTIKKIGDGLLSWIDEDGDAETLVYNQETNIIHDDSSGLMLHIEFSMSGDTVIGSGYMSGTLWDEPIEATIALTKISD